MSQYLTLTNLGYVLSAVLGILAAILFVAGSIESNTKKRVIIAIYAMVPPLWFWFEYTFLYTEGNFEAFKYRQELNRNIWAAVTTVLVVMYFKSDSQPKGHPITDHDLHARRLEVSER